MPISPECLTCGKVFVSTIALRSHCNAKHHLHFACYECDVAFISDSALDSHLRSLRHTEDVEYSESEFDNESCSDFEHQTFCDGCNRDFVSTDALNQHLLHSSSHNWCFPCSRDFATPTALDNHERSAMAHRSRDFKCPFCQSMFKSPSGIAHHIESGCHRITRRQVTAAVHAAQIIPNLSIKRITGATPNYNTTTTLFATGDSFNGQAYECCLCKKKFKKLNSLNTHLNSAAHDEDQFRCPKCKKEFTVISAFIQHLESQTCGMAKPATIDRQYTDLTDRMSRLLKF